MKMQTKFSDAHNAISKLLAIKVSTLAEPLLDSKKARLGASKKSAKQISNCA